MKASPALIPVEYVRKEFEHPAKVEPAWSRKVDRWYQLDPYAHGLVEGCSSWKDLSLCRPGKILLASPCASNETDIEFCRGGARNPTKFVHTLPNIRSAPLCQAMNWSGPVLCLQNDPVTVLRALEEGAEFYWEDPEIVWVLSVTREDEHYVTHIFELGGAGDLSIDRTDGSVREGALSDTDLFQWLRWDQTQEDSFSLPGGNRLLRKRRPL
jgi:hypothetical protein